MRSIVTASNRAGRQDGLIGRRIDDDRRLFGHRLFDRSSGNGSEAGEKVLLLLRIEIEEHRDAITEEHRVPGCAGAHREGQRAERRRSLQSPRVETLAQKNCPHVHASPGLTNVDP